MRNKMILAVRGAIQVDADDADLIIKSTSVLMREVIRRNELCSEDVVNIFFTMTPDLTSEFPAAAVRKLGWDDVPLMCATEVAVPHSLPRVIRLMALIKTDRPRSEVRHVYLHGAARLRPDLASADEYNEKPTMASTASPRVGALNARPIHAFESY
jgi:chorismate mutase